MANPLRKINKMVRREQSQGGRIGGGPDEPTTASMRKGKPGRTAPSSRVKKIAKEGNPKFVGPKQNRENYDPEYEGSEKFAGPYSQYNAEDNQHFPEYRSKTEGQQLHRDFQQEQSKKGRKKEYTSNRKREFRLKKAGVISDRPLKANDIYYELRKNLSPANQRLLDILTRNTEEDNVIPF